MPPIRFNGSTNYNASDVARRAQARATFANSLVNQKTVDQSCLNRVTSGPSAATSYSANKVADQRAGAIFTTPAEAAAIVASSPCIPQYPLRIPIPTPNYELSCSDPAGIQIMATGTFTQFTFTTTSQGAGVIEFQFFFQDTYVSSQLVVLGVDSNLIIPPAGIDEVRYVFKCNPINVSLSCAAVSKVLQWTNPYSFTYTSDLSGDSVELTLYQHTSGTITHTVYAGQTYTPTPSWGYDSWSITPCLGSLVFPGVLYNQLYLDPAESLSLGAGDFTVEWYQYYDDTTTIAFPTVFAYGTYNDNLIVEVYYDNVLNQFTYYEGIEGGIAIYSNIPDPYRNVWCHFALCRSDGIVYIYQNGYLIGQDVSTADLSTSEIALNIGNEESPSETVPFRGSITNFRLVKGVALYPDGTEFTPPSAPLVNVPGTQLLLLAANEAQAFVDSSSANRTVNNWYDNVTWSSDHP